MPMLAGVVPEACLLVAKELASLRGGWASTLQPPEYAQLSMLLSSRTRGDLESEIWWQA